ncbi:MAG: SAM-dependent chlorinase/fluorinase [Gemmatimonadales bacterium]|jgi:S-adenosylmethionine hydrolase
MRLITLLTDFGTADGFVGEVKGELLTRAPEALPVDIGHDVPPGDIAAASWALERIWDRFPAGTIHLVVVDPGGGGPRRGVIARVAGRWYVGPDNGTLTRVLVHHEAEEVRVLEEERAAPQQGKNARPVSRTFHGRDVFAPAAARLARGDDPAELGSAADPGELVTYHLPRPVSHGDNVRGNVTHIDRFGNLVTDIPARSLAPSALIEIGGEVISGVRSTYASVEPGQIVALIGSTGMLEISVRDGNAAERLSVERGHTVHARPERD